MDICQALHLWILDQPERKVTHLLANPNRETPKQIRNALPFIPLPFAGNTVIAKRYDPGEESGAFRVHRDPEKFAGSPLVLCTLGGRAKLSVIVEDRLPVEIDCVPNTVVIAHNNPMHSVTPPLDDETRTFMFVGSDSTLTG